MLFNTRTPPRNIVGSRSRTPTKVFTQSIISKKKQAPSNTSKPISNQKYKSRDTMILIQSLQDIYSSLSFNQFDAFPIDNILQAKQRINQLYKFYKGQAICPKHQDLLNLYCQTDKEVICVSCVYKGANQHKTHKVKALQTVQKTLDYQTIRNDQKCKALVHQLYEIKDDIQKMQKQISQQYTIISNYTLRMFQQAISQLESLKREMQKKLNLSFRRTTTVISRYREALQQMTNMIDSNIQKSISVSKLSKYLILKSILNQGFLIDDLIGKYTENKVLIDQWKRSTRQFEKSIVRKKFQPTNKVDTYLVTEF